MDDQMQVLEITLHPLTVFKSIGLYLVYLILFLRTIFCIPGCKSNLHMHIRGEICGIHAGYAQSGQKGS